MQEAANKGNILYISYDGMTDPLGQSQVIPYIEGLSKKGYAFTLISFEKPGRFEKFSAEISSRLQKSNIDWAPLSYTKSPLVLSTLWDIWRMRKKAFKLNRSKAFKLVHCRSYLSAMVGLAMKRRFGTKFVFDMRGFYADERVDGGIWNLSNPLYKMIYDYFKRREIEFFSNADYSVSLTSKGKKIIQAWREIPGQPVPIEVIPCCADLDLFSVKTPEPGLLQQLRQKHNLVNNEFVLSYLGSIGTWYMLDEMLDFFKCLLEYKPGARFLFITGDPVDEITEKAKTRGIPLESLIITFAPRTAVPAYLALSTWAMFFIKPVFSKSASSPTKQGEIMGMGLPQVCNSGVGDVDAVVDGKTGVLVETFDATHYHQAIQQMLAWKNDAAHIEQRAEEFYSLKNGVEKYGMIYTRLLASPRPVQ